MKCDNEQSIHLQYNTEHNVRNILHGVLNLELMIPTKFGQQMYVQK
jgi:hypothetical protein